MVIPLKRQVTLQRARKGASRMGLIRASCPQPYGPTPAASSKIAPGDFVDALARKPLLRALRMRYGHSTRRASRLRPSASETRLMRIVEIGSNRPAEGHRYRR